MPDLLLITNMLHYLFRSIKFDEIDRFGGKEMENTPSDKVDTAQGIANPSRRRLLKLLSAGGAVTAVTLLPGKWSSPSIKTGVLPAHAQVTPGRYEVRCNPEWDSGPGKGEVIWYLSATAWVSKHKYPALWMNMPVTTYR